MSRTPLLVSLVPLAMVSPALAQGGSDVQMPGWPLALGDTFGVPSSVVLADLDRDGEEEMVANNGFQLHAVRRNGMPLPGFPVTADQTIGFEPAIDDLEGDGEREIVFGESDALFLIPVCWVLDADGGVRPGFPFVPDVPGGTYGPYATHDLDGDGRLEILFGHTWKIGSHGLVYGLHADGTEVPGFQLKTHLPASRGLTFGDLDGDGDVEIVATSSLLVTGYLNVFDLKAAYRPSPENGRGLQKSRRHDGDAGRSEHLHLAGRSLRGGASRCLGLDQEAQALGRRHEVVEGDVGFAGARPSPLVLETVVVR